jgi:hypothetical protein
MTLNDQIQAYLFQNNISFVSNDYMTGQPEGEPDQVLQWNTEKLGTQPTQEQLDAAWASYVPPTPAAPTKEQLLAELQALTAKINSLE